MARLRQAWRRTYLYGGAARAEPRLQGRRALSSGAGRSGRRLPHDDEYSGLPRRRGVNRHARADRLRGPGRTESASGRAAYLERVDFNKTRFARPIKVVNPLYLYGFRANLRVYRITFGDSD